MSSADLSATLLASLLLLQCGQQGTSAPEQSTAEDASVEVESTSSRAVSDSVWAQQKLIRSALIAIEVASVEEALDELDTVAARRDALVADTRIEQYGASNCRATLTVRVPASSFDGMLRDVRGLGDVESESTRTEDVTKAYADLGTRLSVKRQTEQRLRDLLSSRTGVLAEILQVERELARLVGEIEQLAGERRYYDHRIAVSTIDIELWESGAALGLDVFAPVGDALADSLSVLAKSVGALLYLTAFLSPWLLVGAPIWLIAKRTRRR